MSSVKSGAIPQDIGPLVATYIIELSFGIAVFELFNIPILFILSIP